jgi:hypothetical protein
MAAVDLAGIESHDQLGHDSSRQERPQGCIGRDDDCTRAEAFQIIERLVERRPCSDDDRGYAVGPPRQLAHVPARDYPRQIADRVDEVARGEPPTRVGVGFCAKHDLPKHRHRGTKALRGRACRMNEQRRLLETSWKEAPPLIGTGKLGGHEIHEPAGTPPRVHAPMRQRSARRIGLDGQNLRAGGVRVERVKNGAIPESDNREHRRNCAACELRLQPVPGRTRTMQNRARGSGLRAHAAR